MRHYFAVVIIFILIYCANIYLTNVCIGSNENSVDSEAHWSKYADMKLRFYNKNCTIVLGDLLIAHVDIQSDISFLNSIEEVTGYIWIYGNSFASLSLPNLRLIRGDSLKSCDSQKNGNCSLVIRKNPNLKYIEFQSLKAINKGDILFSNNSVLCDTPETINWQDLMSEKFPQRITFYKSNICLKRDRPQCSEECHFYKSLNSSYCWTTSKSSCQKLNKCKHYGMTCTDTIWCYPKSQDETDSATCCNDYCLGGCTGPTDKQCHTCLKFRMRNKCLEYCPPLEIFDTSKGMNIKNPDVHFELGNLCVKQCPEHYFMDNTRCVLNCHRPGTVAKGNQCVSCTEDLCPKVCDLKRFSHSYLTKSSLQSLVNCTILNGSLYIFSDSVHSRYSHSELITWNDLKILTSIRHVTGYVKIMVAYYAPWLTNLTFLENLETIGSNLQSPGMKIVHNTHLQFLGLRSLKRVVGKELLIDSNLNLCYSDRKVLNNLQIPSAHVDVSINETLCEEDGRHCHSECDKNFGCWGPGPSLCGKCANYKAGPFLCVSNCSNTPGYLDSDGRDCTPCSAECADNGVLPTCSGPGQHQCLRGCRHVKDGRFCKAQCPPDKFLDNSSGTCLPCSPECSISKTDETHTCSGPSSILQQNGCKYCSFVHLYNINETQILQCLHHNGKCPRGTHLKTIMRGQNNQYLKTYPILSRWMSNHLPTQSPFGLVCLPCSHSCKSCQSESYCEVCFQYRQGSDCTDSCSIDYYESNTTTGTHQECLPCHNECSNGCFGPLPSQCHQCRNFRVVMQNSTQETCISACPPWAPYRHILDYFETVCSNEPAATSVVEILKIIPVFIIVTIAILCLIFILYRRRIREMKKRDSLNSCSPGDSTACEMELTCLPNMATLLLTEESSLAREFVVGSGAFGTVYKGTWQRPSVVSSVNDMTTLHIHDNREKMPVAIKVLSDVTDPAANKDFIEEAKVMATVSHPCCVKILAICLTAQPQIVCPFMRLGNLLDYVRNNRQTCNSRLMLQWASQIASGMAYLKYKDIIHRDLAARNVLLQTTSQAKITDFGLAKRLSFEESSYKSKSERMPIKWLAIESLKDKVFSHKSDVWAFGVTLWEILTFGKQPYPNISFMEICPFLDKGQRLAQPQICSLDLYALMIQCWLHDPEARPTFDELKDTLNSMLNHPNVYIDFSNITNCLDISQDSQSNLLYYNLNNSSLTTKSEDSDGYLVPISNEEATSKDETVSLLGVQNNPLYLENEFM